MAQTYGEYIMILNHLSASIETLRKVNGWDGIWQPELSCRRGQRRAATNSRKD